jgi:4-hydroxy-tetrahydrodipicolinate synthase
MVKAALEDRWDEARIMHFKLLPLFHNLLKLDPNPVPIKHALHIAGKLPSPEARLPLAGLSEEKLDRLKALLEPWLTG